MKYINIIITAILLLSLLLTSCTEVVDIDLPYDGDKLIVEASIDYLRGTNGEDQTIRLSRTTEYLTEMENPAVTGALVTVTKDDSGTEFIFEDQGNGTYVASDFEAVIAQRYTLTIELNGNTYTATETLMPVSDINRLVQSTELGLSNEDIEVTLYYNDFPNEENYYMAEFVPSHKPLPQIWVFPDQFTDGNEASFFYEDEDIAAGDNLEVILRGISSDFYYFMNVIITQSSQNFFGPFQPAPVQAKGNISNEDNPDEEVLGFFRLSEAVTEQYVIE